MFKAARILLATAALLLLASGLFHASAFTRSFAALPTASIPTFHLGVYKAFWLMDSAVQIVLAALLVAVATRPAANRTIIFLLSLVPGATAVLLYYFVGRFFAAHILVFVTAILVAAGLVAPVDRGGVQPQFTDRG